MLSYEEALQSLLDQAVVVEEARSLPLTAAHGRILASVQYADSNVPPLDNSAMDGYALRCADVPQVATVLPISQRIPAGQVGTPLAAGTVARIFTGAPIPAGADAVVMQERCTLAGAGMVSIDQLPQPGANIRRAGEDIAQGSAVLAAGLRLSAAHIGLAASLGLATLPVRRRLRVALLSTGDELTEPGQPLPPGSIYNSNRYFLEALLTGLGCAVSDLGRIPDQLDATRTALRTAAETHDLILSTGGVSVGEEDHIKPAIEAEGQLALWKIAIKPGKPLAFGQIRAAGRQTDFIGLPGNPVSSFITFLMLVRPYLLKRMGASHWHAPRRAMPAASDWLRADKRREFLRAQQTADGRVALYPRQGSGVLTSCAWADGLIDNPPEQCFRAGDTVSFIALSDLLCH
jgi:molybdopterin molybdotransferase